MCGSLPFEDSVSARALEEEPYPHTDGPGINDRIQIMSIRTWISGYPIVPSLRSPGRDRIAIKHVEDIDHETEPVLLRKRDCLFQTKV